MADVEDIVVRYVMEIGDAKKNAENLRDLIREMEDTIKSLRGSGQESFRVLSRSLKDGLSAKGKSLDTSNRYRQIL